MFSARRAVLGGVVLALLLAWAGPAAADDGRGRPVKYYVVPPPVNGQQEYLYAIAQKTLGDGNRYPEIFALNKGRLQPDGGRLVNPAAIRPGWVLRLPRDASGAGVRFGPLPAGPPPPVQGPPDRTPPPSPRPSPPASGSGSSPSLDVLTLVLFLVMVAATGVLVHAVVTRRGRERRHRREAGPGGQHARGGSGGRRWPGRRGWSRDRAWSGDGGWPRGVGWSRRPGWPRWLGLPRWLGWLCWLGRFGRFEPPPGVAMEPPPASAPGGQPETPAESPGQRQVVSRPTVRRDGEPEEPDFPDDDG